MSVTHRLLCPAIAVVGLAGCATAPAPVAVVSPPATIAVSCETDSLTDHPCLDAARKRCPTPAVDTIHLVLAKQVPAEAQPAPKAVYEYQATYNCPGQRVASMP
ncbi:MAG: hypothetical protein ABWX83_15135 [Luteibacter sp.]